MKTKTKVIALTLASAAVVAAGALAPRAALPLHHAPEATTAHSQPARAGFPRWVPGTTYHYDVALHGAATSVVADLVPGAPKGPLHGQVAIAGSLTVRALDGDDGSPRLEIRFADLTRGQITALDHEVFPSLADAKAALVGPTAYVPVDAHGALREVATTADAPALFASVVRSIATSLSTTMPEDGAATLWKALEAAPSGRAHTTYHRASVDATHIVRNVDAYDLVLALPEAVTLEGRQTIEGETAIDVEGDALGRLAQHEHLRVQGEGAVPQRLDAQNDVTMRLVSRERTPAAGKLPEGLDHLALGERAKPSRAVGEKIVDGMVGETTFDDVRRVIMGGGIGMQDGDFTRLAMFLSRHPEHVDDVVKLFTDAGTSGRGRALALDLLSSAGTRDAQRGIRAALSTGAAHKEPREYPMLLQRLTLAGEGDPETTRFLAREYQEARAKGDAKNRFAAAHALAAAAQRDEESDVRAERDAAVSVTRELIHDARQARDPEEKRALIGALGNARSSEATDALEAFAKDGDAEVREQVAHSLGEATGAEAGTALLALATDAEGDVASTAVHSLAGREIGAPELRTLAGLVASGRVPSEASDALLALVVAHHEDPEAARAIADAIVAQAGGDYRLAERARRLRAQL